MFTWDEMGLTFSMPEDFWASLGWYHLLFVTGVYGLITHLKTLPGVHKWDRERKPREGEFPLEFRLLGMLLWRMTFGLPIRILYLALGVVCFFALTVATGKLSNDLLFGWRWHLPPEDIY